MSDIAIRELLNDPSFLQEKLLNAIQENKQLSVNNKQLVEALKVKDGEIDMLKPKGDFYDCVTESGKLIDMSDTAKIIGISGWGRNNIFKLLRDHRILKQNNVPYQEYVDRGYFKLIERLRIRNGEYEPYSITFVFQKGLDYIRKLIEAEIAE